MSLPLTGNPKLRTRLFSIFAIAAILVGMASLSESVSQAAVGQQATMTATTEMGGMKTQQTVLTATTEDGIPKGIAEADWNKALGMATMTMGSEGSDTIE